MKIKYLNKKYLLSEKIVHIQKKIDSMNIELELLSEDIKWVKEAIVFCDNKKYFDDVYIEFVDNTKCKLKKNISALINELSNLKQIELTE